MSIKLQTRSKLRYTPYRLYTTLAGSFAVFSVAFLAAFWASSIFAPINVSDAESVTVRLSGTNYYVKTAASDIDLTLNATPSGALTVGKDTVTTKTNCNGYQLYISAATAETTSIMNPDSHVVEDVPANALILEGSDTTSGDWLSATAGKFTSAAGGPQAFKDSTHNNANTWGFAIPSGSTGLPSAAGSFDATYGTTAEGNVNLENKFAEIPLFNSPALIQETNSSNETGVDLELYYGVYADTGKTSGIYSSDILYTMVGKDPLSTASVSPGTITNLGSNSTISVNTPILTSTALSDSDVTVTVGGESCPVIGTSVTDTNGDPSTLKIVCTAPSVSSVGGLGTYDVVANVTKFGQTFTIANGVIYSLGGTQITSVSPSTATSSNAETLTINTDLTVTGITASDVTATLTNTATSATANCAVLTDDTGITYNGSSLVVRCTKPAGLAGSAIYNVSLTIAGQTVTAAGAFQTMPAFYTITTMQEMTSEVCNSVTAPSNTAYGMAGTNFIPVAPASDGIANSVTYANRSTSEDGGKNVPTRKLIDYRGADGTGTNVNKVLSGANVRTYTVAKLADGNCWMTENLALPLALNKSVEASYTTMTLDTSKLFTYIPTSLGMNGNTGAGTGTYANYWFYTWFAATGEKGTNSTAAGTNVDGSICPLGWILPTNSGTSSWYNLLVTSYAVPVTSNDSRLLVSPISLEHSGTYSDGNYSLGSYGGSGYYLTATSYSTNGLAYALAFYGNNESWRPQTMYNYNVTGQAVRCLAAR